MYIRVNGDFVEKIIYKSSYPLVMYISESGTLTATRPSQDEVFLSALRACYAGMPTSTSMSYK